MELREILYESSYDVLPEVYSIAKVNSNFRSDEIFMISEDSLERTAIFRMGTAREGIIDEKRNYRLIAINVAVPFYAPGFISTISQQLANKNIPVLVVSTYSRDYFIVPNKNLDESISEISKTGVKNILDNTL